jgi:lysine-arginine-ornithine-binding protein
MIRTIGRVLGSVIGIVGLIATTASGPANANDGDDVIRIGVDAAYKPFMWRNEEGNIVGWEIELAKAFCKTFEENCTFQHHTFDSIIPALNAKKFDAIIASMYIKEERKKKVDFTDPYYFIPGKYAAPKDLDIEISKEGLEGKIIGVQRGTLEARHVQNKWSDVARIKLYDSQEQVYLDAVSRRIDMMLAQKLVLKRAFLETDKGQTWEFVGPPVDDPDIYGKGAAVAVRNGDDELRKKFNEAIDTVLANGTYRELQNKWFDFNIYGEPYGKNAEGS